MEQLWALIDKARLNKVDHPTIRLGKYKFKYNSAKSVMYVDDGGKFGESTYYGKMTRRDFTPAYGVTKETITEILAIARDPGPAAKAYGLRTGTCCVCGRALINKESVRLMVGPICLEKYGFSFSELVATEEEDGQIRLEDI